MRIDAHDAVPVSLKLAAEQPDLLKTLYRGSSLDATIVQRIRQRAKLSLGEFWASELDCLEDRGIRLLIAQMMTLS
ncbi:hypothetical protein PGPR2_00210 [Pseudomonas aeruginosa PGPR2]|nr:hypothetical protein PGPR2_00210 [Pseudomonas aeruginosa PGPR2]